MNDEEQRCEIIVLLVDDQAMIAEGISRMLADQDDIQLHYCADPMQAVQQAMALRVTTILQDLVMPDVDGMTLVRFYRNHPRLKDTPVIVLSSKEDPAIKSEAFENGANDYIVKLPDKIELIARIRAHSKSYIAQQERDEAFRKLHAMQAQITHANAQLAEQNRVLEKLSTSDGLTGIANRRCFDERLDKEWRRAGRAAVMLSLIMIDIDFFKLYNDFYGHQGGDDCLHQVAQILEKSVQRASDLVARYGGEEFAVIMPNTDLEGAKRIAEMIRQAVQTAQIPHERSQVSDYVSISVGVSTVMPNADVTSKHLLSVADSALYKAKKDGRNTYRHIDFAHADPKIFAGG